MKELKLTGSSHIVAQVDDEDYDHLSKKKWQLHKCNSGYYARAQFAGKNIMLHRYLIITKNTQHFQVDHIDGNTLNCQRSNLRLATHGQNMLNRNGTPKRAKKHSQYRGVQWHWNGRKKDGTPRESGKWVAVVRFDGKEVVVARTHFEIVAARVYDYWAKRIYGEFARLNAV